MKYLPGEDSAAGLTSEGDISLFPVALDGDEEAYYSEIGLPDRVKLKRDTAWRNIVFKKGTWLLFNTNGGVQSGYLANDQRVDQMSQYFIFQEGSKLTFHDDGVVLSGRLNSIDQVIAEPYGFYVSKNTDIYFFGNGSINTAVVRGPIEVGGWSTKTNTKMIFTEWVSSEGKLPSIRSTVFEQNTILGDYTAKGGLKVMFFDGASIKTPGKVLSLYTVTDVIVQSMISRASTLLTFHPNGKVRHITIGSEATIQGIHLKPETTQIWFYDTGKISALTSSFELTINDKTYDSWVRVELDGDGKVVFPV